MNSDKYTSCCPKYRAVEMLDGSFRVQQISEGMSSAYETLFTVALNTEQEALDYVKELHDKDQARIIGNTILKVL